MSKKISFLLFAIGTFASSAFGQNVQAKLLDSILIGPMVGHTTHNQSCIWLYSRQSENVEVRYKKKTEKNAPYKKQTVHPRSDRNDTSVAVLNDLTPNTEYIYRIVVDGKEEKEGAFKTAPEPYSATHYSYMFASCMSLEVSPVQKAWDEVLQKDYDFQIFHGDNVYANSTKYDVLWEHHLKQRSIDNYAKVLARSATFSTWDDHDFGPNDSDGSTPGKEESLRLFKDVWPNPSYGLPNTPGVFYSFMWGNVQYFVLDNRYNRTSPGSEPSNTMLGIEQRNWLLSGLKKSRAPFKIILSGGTIQAGKEKWADFDFELKTILNFIRDNKIYGVVFQGGDIHMAYFKKYDINAEDRFPNGKTRPALLDYESELGYPVYDIVSSGIAKHELRPWAIVNVDTTLKDPTMTVFFYEQEKFKEKHTIKLSDITPSNTKDLILNSLSKGRVIKRGRCYPISWTTIGMIKTIDIEYKTSSEWMPIVENYENTGIFNWVVPNTNSDRAKIRIKDSNGNTVSENIDFLTLVN